MRVGRDSVMDGDRILISSTVLFKNGVFEVPFERVVFVSDNLTIGPVI